MTEQEFKNLKVNDIIYNFAHSDLYSNRVVKVLYENGKFYIVLDNGPTTYSDLWSSVFYLDEKQCKIDYIKCYRRYNAINYCEHQTKILDEKYKEFIKENIEYFI